MESTLFAQKNCFRWEMENACKYLFWLLKVYPKLLYIHLCASTWVFTWEIFTTGKENQMNSNWVYLWYPI